MQRLKQGCNPAKTNYTPSMEPYHVYNSICPGCTIRFLSPVRDSKWVEIARCHPCGVKADVNKVKPQKQKSKSDCFRIGPNANIGGV